MKEDKISRARRIFGIIFVISLITSIILSVILGPIIGNIFTEINSSLCDSPPCPGPAQPEPSSASDIAALGWITTVLTAISSLVGFVSTSILGWRKDRREAKLADLEHKRLEIELEKQRLELEELKKKNSQ